jgi:UPF0042 nucleotide-binding protein
MAEYLVIGGLSGAGRSTAAATVEDLGWFVIDNVPPALMTRVVELVGVPGSETEKVAFVTGRGGDEHLVELEESLLALRSRKERVRVLFLDAPDEVLVRRFEGTRRRHPVAAEGVSAAIARERRALAPIKEAADVVVDTGDLNSNQLRQRLIELFGGDEPGYSMKTTVASFGYKHGIPRDVDLVLDCRFLPNPYWVEGLREKTGLDGPVRDFVMRQQNTAAFLEKLCALFELLLPAYRGEGKSYLTVAMGCTGGKHRSVVLAEELASWMRGQGFETTVFHRDIEL